MASETPGLVGMTSKSSDHKNNIHQQPTPDAPGYTYQVPGPQSQTQEQLQMMDRKIDSGFEGVRHEIMSLSALLRSLPSDVGSAIDGQTGSSISEPSTPQPPGAETECASCQAAQLVGDREELGDTNHNLRKRIQKLTTELNKRDEEAREARLELAKLRQKESTFRDIILDKTGDPKVSDEQIRDQFLALRQRIQGIVSGESIDVEQMPNLPPNPSSDVVTFFEAESWKQSPVKERLYRVRAKIFSFLYEEILSFPCFGLSGLTIDDESLEGGLIRFQQALQDAKVSDGVIADWVISTIQCAKFLPDVEDRRARDVSGVMLEFLYPILSKGDSCKDSLMDALLQLCENALRLRMNMRTSREGYMAEIPSADFLPDCEELAEGMGVEGGRKSKDASEYIAYTLFGALTKNPKYRGEGKRVLEKAHVILRSK